MPERAPSFVVLSGARDGAFYVRQLLRASAAGRLAVGRIHVVDRDGACLAGRLEDPRLELHVAEWDAWLDERLLDFAPGDHLVPYHWAPHLLLAWLERQARRAGRRAQRGGTIASVGLPFEADTRDGSRALSHATWTCPLTCIEPALCPHTCGPKHWSLADDLAAAKSGEPEPMVFRCLHLAYGVATISMASILAAGRRVRAGHDGESWLVATASHCHGLAALLTLAAAGSSQARDRDGAGLAAWRVAAAPKVSNPG